jgi:Trp operon repressor
MRRQVLADPASGGRSRCVGTNVRVFAELLGSEMERRELKYTRSIGVNKLLHLKLFSQ